MYPVERSGVAVRFLGPDPVETELDRVLEALAAGGAPRDLECRLIDCKEEPGRRDRGGTVIAGQATNEKAAEYLAAEASCFANTAGGGALVVGVADDGTLIGTDLDPERLRHRIYELTERNLTVNVREVEIRRERLLVLMVPEALEPIRHKGRLRWRVADNCVDVDVASWWAGRLQRLGHDWSDAPSGHPMTDARPVAIDVARRYLQASGEQGARELASLADRDLLGRINALTGDGLLTNAGALLFVGRGPAALDYIRRDTPGGDSRLRLREEDRSVLEELAAVEQAIAANNPTIHLPSGLAVGRVSALPILTVRESIINGLAHREWASDGPTTVEHVGATLVVNSPGGFVGGVTPDNIITHPSEPRNRALSELLAKLRVAEREGIGVDRMVRDMLGFGHPGPVIEELAGPRVRTVLLGGAPDVEWMAFLGGFDPAGTANDLDVLLCLDQLVRQGWVDTETAAPVVQKTPPEARLALDHLSRVQVHGDHAIVPISGTLGPPAWRLSDPVRDRLTSKLDNWLPAPARAAMVVAWARHRGRVTTTEVADLVGIAVNHAGQLLKGLEDTGQLAPGRVNRRGRGFFYVPTPDSLRAPSGAGPLHQAPGAHS